MFLVDENAAVLKTRTADYAFLGTIEERQAIVDSMTAVMKAHNGIGLAAPQVGRAERMFIMECDGGIISCYNPVVIGVSEDLQMETEGCLSFPLLQLKVKRPDWISVEYQDIEGKMVAKQLSGIEARCFLHELDHLNGVRFVDKVGPVALQTARQRQKKLKRNL